MSALHFFILKRYLNGKGKHRGLPLPKILKITSPGSRNHFRPHSESQWCLQAIFLIIIVMNQSIKIFIALSLLFFASPCWANTLLYESDWTKPSNGLSAKIIFEYDDTSLPPVKIIHPKLILRNDSPQPINFLKCVYHAGNFSIKTPDGKNIQISSVVRGGPQGAEIVTIKPSGIIELDTYDYGFGINMRSAFVFNTASFQGELNPGEYIIDYSLALDIEQIVNILKQYDWLKSDPDSIWTGKIEINGMAIELK